MTNKIIKNKFQKIKTPFRKEYGNLFDIACLFVFLWKESGHIFPCCPPRAHTDRTQGLLLFDRELMFETCCFSCSKLLGEKACGGHATVWTAREAADAHVHVWVRKLYPALGQTFELKETRQLPALCLGLLACVCLPFVCLSVFQCLPACLLVTVCLLFVCLSTNVCLPACLSACLPACLSICVCTPPPPPQFSSVLLYIHRDHTDY